MTLELGVWRIDGGVREVAAGKLADEARLEQILNDHIEIAAPHLLVIGRQVRTAHDHYIDLLAMDANGNLSVLELKRDRTPRDVVAQLLDYGSWVRHLTDEDIARIFQDYQRNYREGEPQALDDAFGTRFGAKSLPAELNSSHELVIVASELDASSERIIGYLAEQYAVSINGIFFRTFKDGDGEYLVRAWLRDPTQLTEVHANEQVPGEWNGEYYVSFGHDAHRDWEEARKYGFVSAGGGSWYTKTLEMLKPGNRIWVAVPQEGYVGVGKVAGTRIPVDEFRARANGTVKPASELPHLSTARRAADDPVQAEYVVPVDWIHTVPLTEAIKERGFFGNQNTVSRPKAPKWEFTIQRLKDRWEVE